MLNKLALLALATTVFAGVASATPINGGVSITGSDTYTSSAITFMGQGDVKSSTIPGVAPCILCVNLPVAPFQFGAGFTPGFLYQIVGPSGVLSSLYVTSITSATIAPVDGIGNNLTVIGTGILSAVGFDNTTGGFVLTSQNAAGNISFSASAAAAAATPEPSSLILLGTGLLGAAGVARRKFSSKFGV